MSAPDVVYVDERVARGLPSEKDPERAERGIEQVRYIRAELAERLLKEAEQQFAPPEEYLVTITAWSEFLVALTSTGRILAQNGDGQWQELPAPPL